MRYILSDLRLPLGFSFAQMLTLTAKALSLKVSAIRDLKLVRKSVDARNKSDIHFICTVEFATDKALKLDPKLRSKLHEKNDIPYTFTSSRKFDRRPVVVGSGPAGLFAALTLAKAGAEPILLERGKKVSERTADVERAWTHGILDPESNVQFGEGGAGTFSDGKLNTGTRDMRQRYILEAFVSFGAPADILINAKPHIGTDMLRTVVVNMRQEIERLGGEVRFSSKFERFSLKNNAIDTIIVRCNDSTYEIPTDDVILALGHSARDTFEYLNNAGVTMTRKDFSVGVRIEHRREYMDKLLYGDFAGHPALNAADYKLNVFLPDGRGVYTFCMCPGGSVVMASSGEGMVVTNGMSNFARNDENSNSALLVNVGEQDFLPNEGILAGMEYQRALERAAFEFSKSYKAPVNKVGDFLACRETVNFGDVIPSFKPGTVMCSLDEVLPKRISSALREALPMLDQKLHGFAYNDAVLTGVETRSSSPVRIVRNEHYESVSHHGLYPCGEGAGYAGGIMSAAADGIRCAEAVILKGVTNDK